MNCLFELILLPLVVLMAVGSRPGRAPRMHALSRWVARWANRRWLAVGLVGLSANVGCVLTTLALGWPQPNFQDEYSYLLTADTFAHGRLANPPHPMWVHFETFQEIHQPTYASKYPPAQGVVLFVGWLLAKEPIVGVWLSMGLACGAVCWMLQAWVPPRWALLGAFLITLRLVFSGHVCGIYDMTWGYWGRGFFGGAIAVLGGALLFGSLRRMMRQPRARYAVVMGVGLGLLANSRPFEGLVVSLPAAGVLLGWMIGRRRPTLGVVVGRIVVPVLAVLIPTAGAMAYYNWCVTGHPLQWPYLIHEQTYSANPLFLWQTPGQIPEYRHPVMALFWTGWVRDLYEEHCSVAGFLRQSVAKITQTTLFYLGFWLLLALAAVRPALRDPWIRLALGVFLLIILALLGVFAYCPHYAAPVVCLLVVLVVQALRQVRLWRWRGRPAGRRLVWGIALGYPLVALLSLWFDPGVFPDATHLQRAALQSRLEQEGGRHLILVRYLRPLPRGLGHEDWVWNRADIDIAPVVWAREMNPQQDQELLAYFRDRRVWLLSVDAEAHQHWLEPHPLAGKRKGEG